MSEMRPYDRVEYMKEQERKRKAILRHIKFISVNAVVVNFIGVSGHIVSIAEDKKIKENKPW